MPASIAKNYQEGARSEYLAQYALSSFGTAIPVPNPEDSGIDLYCTLGHRIGRRFLVENQYLVQVKSNNDPVQYNGKDEVKWLLSHKYPFFICVVTKKSAKIQVYQTMAVTTISAKETVESITLHPENSKHEEYFPQVLGEKNVDIFLGNPIVKFSVSQFSENEFQACISRTMKSWIELDQENLDLKSTGYTVYRIPETWRANTPVNALKFSGNFKDSFENPDAKHKFNDLFPKMLSQLVNQAAGEKDVEKYNSLIQFINSYLKDAQLTDNFGLRMLQFCVNKGNESLGIPNRLHLSISTK